MLKSIIIVAGLVLAIPALAETKCNRARSYKACQDVGTVLAFAIRKKGWACPNVTVMIHRWAGKIQTMFVRCGNRRAYYVWGADDWLRVEPVPGYRGGRP